MTYVPFLDGLRALAVLMVILNHLDVPGFSGGFIGVDIFFVISGFLITSILAEDYTSNSKFSNNQNTRYVNLRVFYFKRARRILPVALAVIFFSVITAYFVLPNGKFLEEAKNGIWSMLFLSNVNEIVNSTDYFASNLGEKSAFQHFWSLAVEEQFYLFYPFFYLFISRLHGMRSGKLRLYWYRRLAILLGFVWTLSFLYNIVGLSNSPTQIYFSTFSRAWELATGCLLALFKYSKIPALSPKKIARYEVVSLLGIILSSFLLSNNALYPGYLALIPVFASSLLIYSSIYSNSNRSVIIKIFSLNPIRYIGKLSYSLYLIHWPLLIFVDYRFPKFLDSTIGKLIYLSALFVLSIVSYVLIEKPTRKIPVPESLHDKKDSILLIPARWIVSRISGDVLFISLMAVSIFILLGFVRGYTPSVSSPQEFKPFTYPQSNAPENTRMASETATFSTALESQLFNSIRIDWQNEMLIAKPDAYPDKNTDPKLSTITSGKLVAWGTNPIWQSCKDSNPIDMHADFFCDYSNGGTGKTVNVLLVGDSHAQQLIPTIVSTFKAKNMNLIVHGRTGCPIGGNAGSTSAKSNSACLDLWQTKTQIRFASQKFDFVFVSEFGKFDAIESKLAALKFLKSIGSKIILFPPTPRYPNLQSCKSADSNLGRCFGLRSPSLDAKYLTLANTIGADFFPSNDFLCSGTVCPAIIRNKIVNVGDGSHLTRAITEELSLPLSAFLGLS